MSVIKDQVDAVPRVVGRLGFWSAVLSTIFSMAFNVAAIVERLGVLATPWDRVGLMASYGAEAPTTNSVFEGARICEDNDPAQGEDVAPDGEHEVPA